MRAMFTPPERAGAMRRSRPGGGRYDSLQVCEKRDIGTSDRVIELTQDVGSSEAPRPRPGRTLSPSHSDRATVAVNLPVA